MAWLYYDPMQVGVRKVVKGLKIIRPGATYIRTPPFNLSDFTIVYGIVYYYGNKAMGSTMCMVWGSETMTGKGYFVADTRWGRGILFATRSTNTGEYFNIGYDSGVEQVGKTHTIVVGRESRTWKLWFDGKFVTEKEDNRSGIEVYFRHRIATDWQWEYPHRNRVPSSQYVNPRVFLYVMFYSRLLSDGEVRKVTSNPYNPPRNGLLLWYVASNIEGATVYDLSGNGNHGELRGTYYEWVTLP